VAIPREARAVAVPRVAPVSCGPDVSPATGRANDEAAEQELGVLFISEGALLFGGLNDRPDALVTDASMYEIMVAVRSNRDLAFLDDLGVEWSYNSRLFGEGVYR
jgi:hypothetical protein